MGMDVYGRKPINETGKYFRNNVWYWRPLADLCQELAPDICKACTHWQSNDGDGLDAAGAEALAAVLDAKLADGTIAKYVVDRDAWLEALPDEPCRLCVGKGVRSDALALQHGWDKKACNSCDGKGTQRPSATHYPCDVENVAEFAAFLKACGGFNIH